MRSAARVSITSKCATQFSFRATRLQSAELAEISVYAPVLRDLPVGARPRARAEAVSRRIIRMDTIANTRATAKAGIASGVATQDGNARAIRSSKARARHAPTSPTAAATWNASTNRRILVLRDRAWAS